MEAGKDPINKWFFADGCFSADSELEYSPNTWQHENFVVIQNREIIAYLRSEWCKPLNIIKNFASIIFNMVIITHSDGTHSLYGHQSAVNVTVGQTVSAGEQIGAVGTTGKSTGPHLHLGYDGNGDGLFSRTDSMDNPERILYADGY